MEEVTTLTDLGLTLVQAKTYLAIARSGVLNINALSEASKVPRTDLYRVLKDLENRGFVERVIANPTQFKAIPIGECLDVLIQQRTAKSLDLQGKAAQIRWDPKYKNIDNQAQTGTSRFILIPSNRASEKIGDAIDSAKESIDIAISWDRFSHGVYLYSEKIENAWQRNVACRFVVGLPEDREANLETVAFGRQSSLCSVKFVVNPLQTVMGIYDRNQVFIIENPKAGLKESPALWSNNSSMVSLAKDFFEILWITAMDDSNYKIDK
jgi:sugar-specific transcriptional regulator TrmB